MELTERAVEGLVVNRGFWSGKKVLITGHTGFKGSWLALWLHKLGARVTGYVLDPATDPSLFGSARLASIIEDGRGDVRDAAALNGVVSRVAPEIVFHLAAQPLVLESYRRPVETFATNVLGTVHLLDALRVTPARVCVVVTSDKCYAIDERDSLPHNENDALGGSDPYSSSKACAELVTASYRHSFFLNGQRAMALASARAGNVIGGGDWAADRLIPDLLRAFRRGEAAVIRNPAAIRPWQHVLEPLSGYLTLAEMCYDNTSLSGPWNFGPEMKDEATVADVVERVRELWAGGAQWRRDEAHHPAETMVLRLDSTKARQQLQWRSRLRLSAALEWTVKWYAQFYRDPDAARHLVEADIERYEAAQ